METAELRLFVTVAQRGGFAAAARDLDLDPSAVSRGIAGLEAQLGVRLFQRTTRKMALTEAGQALLSRVQAPLEELERARDELRSLRTEPSGTLRLTTSVSFGQIWLLPLLPVLRRTFPRIQLEVLLTDTNLDLIADRIDLAIRLAPSYRGEVIGTKLFSTRYRVVASPDYVARYAAPKAPSDLSAHSCLLFSLPDFRERWLFRKAGVTEVVPVRGHLISSAAFALRSAALDGLGPVLLADWHLASELASGRLVDLFPSYEVTATTFDTAAWLLYPSRSYLPHKVRAMIEFLREHLRGERTQAQPRKEPKAAAGRQPQRKRRSASG